MGGFRLPPHHPRESAVRWPMGCGAELPRGHFLTGVVRDAIWVLRAEGVSEAEIGRRLGLPKWTVSRYL